MVWAVNGVQWKFYSFLVSDPKYSVLGMRNAKQTFPKFPSLPKVQALWHPLCVCVVGVVLYSSMWVHESVLVFAEAKGCHQVSLFSNLRQGLSQNLKLTLLASLAG